MTIVTEQASSKAINLKIKSIKTTGKRFNDLVHETMVMVVTHAEQYGDCTGAARLVDAMPMSNRRSLVIDHFTQYSPIRVAKSAKTGQMNASLRKEEDKEYNAFNLAGLKLNRWDERPEVENEPDILTFDVAKDNVFKLLKSIEKKAEKSSDEHSIKAWLRKVRTAIVTTTDTDDNAEVGVAPLKAA